MYATLACATLPFFWLLLKQKGWRWTQPARSSLCLSAFFPPYCQADSPLSAVVFSPLPLTTESCGSSNAERMRIGLSRYLKQHSWMGTRMISQTVQCSWVLLTEAARFQQCAEAKGRSLEQRRHKEEWKLKKRERRAAPDSCCLPCRQVALGNV